MDIRLLKAASFFLAISGLALIYFFSPSQTPTANGCSGQMAIEANISSISVTSEGNIVATVYQNGSKILVFLQGVLAEQGDRIFVIGRASRFSNQCWLFPEKVEQR